MLKVLMMHIKSRRLLLSAVLLLAPFFCSAFSSRSRHAIHRTPPTNDNYYSSVLPPPPDPTSNPADDGFRSMRKNIPVAVQYWLRDSGALRLLVDTCTVCLGVPAVLKQYPDALTWYLRLSNTPALQQAFLKWIFQHEKQNDHDFDKLQEDDTKFEIAFEKVAYGKHPSQIVHLYKKKDSTTHAGNTKKKKNLVVFVHGGAWGSGFPALYRLTATPFLMNKGNSDVAVIGYRTYPTATNVYCQVEDVANAVARVVVHDPPYYDDVTLIGHSSGAHVCALALEQNLLVSSVDRFIGISGVYNIPAHYRYEAGRGVARISPLTPACLVGDCKASASSPEKIGCPTLLCHGALDTTVPYTQSIEFGISANEQHNNKCTVHILPETEHAETVLHLMFGGETRNLVLDWIQNERTTRRTY